MENVWVLAAFCTGLDLLATLLAIRFRVSTALTEIVAGTVIGSITGVFIVQDGLRAKAGWTGFLAGTGAIIPLPIGAFAFHESDRRVSGPCATIPSR